MLARLVVLGAFALALAGAGASAMAVAKVDASSSCAAKRDPLAGGLDADVALAWAEECSARAFAQRPMDPTPQAIQVFEAEAPPGLGSTCLGAWPLSEVCGLLAAAVDAAGLGQGTG